MVKLPKTESPDNFDARICCFASCVGIGYPIPIRPNTVLIRILGVSKMFYFKKKENFPIRHGYAVDTAPIQPIDLAS